MVGLFDKLYIYLSGSGLREWRDIFYGQGYEQADQLCERSGIVAYWRHFSDRINPKSNVVRIAISERIALISFGLRLKLSDLS